jgi:hypothetical protein
MNIHDRLDRIADALWPVAVVTAIVAISIGVGVLLADLVSA